MKKAKRKVKKIDLSPLFDVIAVICKEYNEKHKTDPIIGVSRHFKHSEK